MNHLKSIILIILIILFTTSFIILSIPHKFTLSDSEYEYSYDVIDYDKLSELIDHKESFIVYTYNPYCSLPIRCDEIFKPVHEELGIRLYGIPYGEIRKTSIAKRIQYAPSVLLYKKGKLVTFLDPTKEEHKDTFQDQKLYKEWLTKYINTK